MEIASCLTAELNYLYCLNLAKRGSGLPTAELGGCKLVMIGGSHTAKISALSRHSGTTEYIPLPGQPLSSDTVTNLEEKMGLYNLGEKDILYIDLFLTQSSWEATTMGCLSLRSKTPQVHIT